MLQAVLSYMVATSQKKLELNKIKNSVPQLHRPHLSLQDLFQGPHMTDAPILDSTDIEHFHHGESSVRQH